MSKSNEWETPSELFEELDREFHFTLDPCCTKENAKCERYFTAAEDGLSKSWKNEVVFMNPPYGTQIGKWIEKAYKESLEGTTIVCLIPARTDTKYWHKFIFGKAEIRFMEGRVKFSSSKHPAPFPSAVVVFKKGVRVNFFVNRPRPLARRACETG
jgi:site-specific DNA-methyltransferase (adenine-specific)